jgi:hypothetical protein
VSQKDKLKKIVENQKKNAKIFSDFEKIILNHFTDSKLETPHVNLKYFSSDWECFSAWTAQEMKLFSGFIGKLRSLKWQDIFASGGKLGQKTGVARTVIDRSKYPKDNKLLSDVSEEITLFELRIDQRIRVHGFRCHEAFYLVYLDREHRMSNT